MRIQKRKKSRLYENYKIVDCVVDTKHWFNSVELNPCSKQSLDR